MSCALREGGEGLSGGHLGRAPAGQKGPEAEPKVVCSSTGRKICQAGWGWHGAGGGQRTGLAVRCWPPALQPALPRPGSLYHEILDGLSGPLLCRTRQRSVTRGFPHAQRGSLDPGAFSDPGRPLAATPCASTRGQHLSRTPPHTSGPVQQHSRFSKKAGAQTRRSERVKV